MARGGSDPALEALFRLINLEVEKAQEKLRIYRAIPIAARVDRPRTPRRHSGRPMELRDEVQVLVEQIARCVCAIREIVASNPRLSGAWDSMISTGCVTHASGYSVAEHPCAELGLTISAIKNFVDKNGIGKSTAGALFGFLAHLDAGIPLRGLEDCLRAHLGVVKKPPALSDLQRSIYMELEGQGLTILALANSLGKPEPTIRDNVRWMRKKKLISWRRSVGFYRPDAPPALKI